MRLSCTDNGDTGLQRFWGHEFDLLGSRDVIGHVTIRRFFLQVSNCNSRRVARYLYPTCIRGAIYISVPVSAATGMFAQPYFYMLLSMSVSAAWPTLCSMADSGISRCFTEQTILHRACSLTVRTFDSQTSIVDVIHKNLKLFWNDLIKAAVTIVCFARFNWNLILWLPIDDALLT